MDLIQFRSEFIEILRQERTKQRLSQGDLAAMLGVKQAAVAKYENPRLQLSVDLASRALNALGYEVQLSIVKAVHRPEVGIPVAPSAAARPLEPEPVEPTKMMRILQLTAEAEAQGIHGAAEINAYILQHMPDAFKT